MMIDFKAIQYYGRTSNGDTATVTLKKDQEEITASAHSKNGPVDALYSAINKALGSGYKLTLLAYNIQSQERSSGALGLVTVAVALDDDTASAQAEGCNILEASARAYVDAVNKILLGREPMIPENLKEFDRLKR